MCVIQYRSFTATSAMKYRAAITTLLTVAGFATAATAEAAPTTLRISSARVEAGSSLRVAGTGWPRLRGVSLYVVRRGGAPKRVKTVRADRRGRFANRVRFDDRARLGRYMIRACSARCGRSRRVSFRIVRRMRVTPTTPALPVPQQPPVIAPPVIAPLPRDAVAEFDRRMRGTRFFDSERLGDCTSFCSLSEETQRFCTDGTWTEDSQESGISNTRSHEEGTWRIVSATLGEAETMQGEVTIVFGENSDAVLVGALAAGHTKTVSIVFDAPRRASIDGRGYAVSLPGLC